MKSVFFYDYPVVGMVGIAEENNAIAQVFFCHEKRKEASKGFRVQETPLIKKAAEQIREYLEGKRVKFDLPLMLQGTDFQVSVWKALQTIPAGETRSYGEIAAQIGKPKACRAVGMANHNNPVAIVVPCHRVVGWDGSLTGYGGGLPLKRYLLDLEKKRA
jgi:methylated-DNA-[protein]-cysteine S-methyltransferase